jgi:bidirectional [NiFe] hydrogenase diaphorase subunit
MSEIKGSQERKIRFTIDGKEVEAMEGWTVLDTARQNGVHIPTLCFHEAVKASGACRLCVVEAKQGGWSKVVISCMYPPSEGLEVLTRSERVMNVRRWILEMLLAECPASKEIRILAAEYGVKKTRFKIENPEEQCLLCGLCVRACEEVVGVRAISFGSRGITKKITSPYMIPNKSCIACGSCVTICPTGAMQARLDAVRGDVSERTGKGFAH